MAIEGATSARTVAKTLSWRFFATGSTIIIGFLLTGSWGTAFAVGVPDVLIKSILYFQHERVWLSPSFQSVSRPLLYKMVNWLQLIIFLHDYLQLSWKVIALTCTILIAYAVNGDAEVAFKLGCS
eukprot:m.210235 g.210235  ORF g.210235 m.210235 type:complete len:125 (-) comp15822_c0_seq5:2246-2620(-)